MTRDEIIEGLKDIKYLLSYTEMYLPEQYVIHKKTLDNAIRTLEKSDDGAKHGDTTRAN